MQVVYQDLDADWEYILFALTSKIHAATSLWLLLYELTQLKLVKV